jgi:hypothetical protein
MRSCAHAAVGAAAWVLLGALWLWQIEAHHVPAHWLLTVAVVLGVTIVFAGLCVGWVSWNRNIYRRRHNRRVPIVSDVQFDSDALGRLIVASDEGRLASHLIVEIDAAASRKHYRVRTS